MEGTTLEDDGTFQPKRISTFSLVTGLGMINFGLFRNLCVSCGSLQCSVPSQIATLIDPSFLKRAGNFSTIKLTRFPALPAGRAMQCKYFRL